ncbi:hypothetical protein GCL60_08360 [Silvanigrella paludirubra]|uniref:Tail specific protease domain-containing protein n=1 Tax=Silvanigrella paludirubra TaxID=2499159 RepID=A0A6N6VVX2_9BACT|nr:S41 family peptidase [Silvanigrella paludirubra]KAB8038859.1 hypothetical protein GCL60_08360 [Silvanigrella paludirubra]
MNLKKSIPILKYSTTILCSFILFSSCGKGNISSENNILNSENKSSYSKNKNNNKLKWELPELTQEEKENLISSVKTVFNDFYVNRLQKITDYHYDALREANKLNINMSSNELLRNTMSIFMNIRDLHTGFKYPLPARCVIGGFPLKVDLSYDINGKNEKLIISKKLAAIPNFDDPNDNLNYNDLQLNDEILSISNIGIEGLTTDEMPVKIAINELGKYTRGANEDAYKTRSVQNFFSRNGAYLKTPEGKFTIKVKKSSDGSIKEYSFPWQSYKSAADICNTNKSTKEKFNNFNNIMNNSLFYKLNKTNQEESIENFYQSSNTASSANITTRIAERGDKKFGIIRLNMFLPSGDYDLNDYLVAREKIINEVNIIRSFVLENKDKISGIIFDVRANGGGYGSFPQLIANLFTNQFVKNMDVRPLVSQTNSDTFYNLEMSRYFSRKGTKDELSAPFLDTVNEMEKLINDKFTKNLVNNREVLLEAADRFDGDENDALPPNYTKENTDILKPIFTDKPIAVLTNSNCYSACDVFTSLFKDYKIARIFGETKHTGGGGANVIEWKDFLIPVVIDERGTKSSIIPNGKPLPKGSEIRFAWNKIKRVNNSKTEQYIEGNGVISDYIYKPTSYDVLNNDENIFNKIMDDMSNYKNPKKFYLNR